MKGELFGIVDLGVGLVWLLLILFFAFRKRARIADREDSRYFIPGVLFKLFFGVVFAAVYVLYYQGGDTVAYWEGAVNLNRLFWDNPSAYFEEMFTTPVHGMQFQRFNLHTGYPPSWIYREPESWFVSKLISILAFFTFNSYIAITLILSYLSALASWRLFETVRSYSILSPLYTAIATLFIPTVAIWCSGISKDTFIYISLLFLVYRFFGIFSGKQKLSGYGACVIVFYLFILYHVRPFMLIAILPPLFLAFSSAIVRRMSDNKMLILVFRTVVGIVTLGVIAVYFQSQGSLGSLGPETYLEEAALIQQDFAQNHLYTGKRYDLGVTDYSLWGMIKTFPAALIAAFYRPFLWESGSIFLMVSGIESMLFIFFTLKFVFSGGGVFRKIRLIRKNELLTFSLLFILIFGFSVGFTAILFGVLVRFKAPILPFLVIVLAAGRIKKDKAKAIITKRNVPDL